MARRTAKRIDLVDRLAHPAPQPGQQLIARYLHGDNGRLQYPGDETAQAKINARIVTDLYSQWIIPLTKRVEVLYLMAR